MNLLIFAATEGEIKPLRETLDKGHLASHNISICATGPGNLNTVFSLAKITAGNHFDLMIQTGCAGVFRDSGLSVGDIAIAMSETDLHTGIENPENPFVPAPLPFPVTETGNITNHYLADTFLSEKALKAASRHFGERAAVAAGPFVTVSTITASDNRAESIYSAYKPVMESMEGSGAFHVSHLTGIPIVEIRSASNFVGKRERETWELPLAFRRSCEAVYAFIKSI